MVLENEVSLYWIGLDWIEIEIEIVVQACSPPIVHGLCIAPSFPRTSLSMALVLAIIVQRGLGIGASICI